MTSDRPSLESLPPEPRVCATDKPPAKPPFDEFPLPPRESPTLKVNIDCFVVGIFHAVTLMALIGGASMLHFWTWRVIPQL